MKKTFFLGLFFMAMLQLQAQDTKELLRSVKVKYDRVDDYTATGKLKTNVIFIKAPVATVKIFYKKPDKLKIKNERGISFIPKGTVNINMNNILGLNNFEAVAADSQNVGGTVCRVVKIFPLNDEEDIVRATLYIDEKQLLVIKSVISTRENGTYELLLSYKNYADWGLPDKVDLTFNTKEYRLPKGVTIDYDNGTDKTNTEKMKNRKGKVEITYSNYIINKGVPDSVFK